LEVFSLEPSERLLLCSDGLWGVLDQQAMTQIINQSEDLDQAVQLLVQSANEAGGPDNISAILVERLG
jgi:protein phosphatase